MALYLGCKWTLNEKRELAFYPDNQVFRTRAEVLKSLGIEEEKLSNNGC